MSKVKTCERSTKYIHYVDKEKMGEYCNRDKRALDTLVEPQPTKTQSQRFFAEEWVNVCKKNQNGLSIACNLYDNMKSLSLGSYNTHCYPTRRIDEYTGKLDKELNDTELEIICGKRIVRSIDVPHDIMVTIDFGKELLKNGYERVKYGYKEDFTIPEKNLTSETLFLWKSWMDRYGPQHRYVLKGWTNNIRQAPNSVINTPNYYVNYVNWRRSNVRNIKDKRNYSGAVEWVLKGGDLAYLWLQSEDVINKIEEKYREDKF